MGDGCCQNRSGAGTYDRDDIHEPKVLVQGNRENSFPTDPPGIVRNAAGAITIDTSEPLIDAPFGKAHDVSNVVGTPAELRVQVFGGTLPKTAFPPSKQGRFPVNADGETVLDEANRVINGPRAAHYGDATVNHQRIADYWNSYIRHLATARNGEIELQPHDIAVLMILLKIARVVETSDHRDSFVDTIGYAALAHLMAVKGTEPGSGTSNPS